MFCNTPIKSFVNSRYSSNIYVVLQSGTTFRNSCVDMHAMFLRYFQCLANLGFDKFTKDGVGVNSCWMTYTKLFKEDKNTTANKKKKKEKINEKNRTTTDVPPWNGQY